MPLALVFGLVLLFASPGAYAMGDPSVLYLLGGEVLSLLGLAVWILFTAKPLARKVAALGIVLLGVVGIVVIHSMPDYLARQMWIESLAAICILLTAMLALWALRGR